MPKYKLLVKRIEEYTMIINVVAPTLDSAIEMTSEEAYDDKYGDKLDKGYNQCYYAVTEHVVLASDVTP